jgi:anti-sigma regulatory factor (Ser/Thr protein kinase)
MRSLGLSTTDSTEDGITMSAGPSRFSCQLIADPAQLRPARHAIACWAAGVGLGPERVDDLALAVGEALSNSIEHAYPTATGPIEIDGLVVETELRVEVHDHGDWRAPRAHPGWRGRGISMIHALADHAEVERRERGTTVTMSWSLRS